VTRRAAIYCRISKDREGAGLGVDRQELDCRALAARLGWDIVAVHTDNDLSAFSGKRRPGYEALLDELRSGHADAVITWHLDRLHRSPVELEGYIAACSDGGRDIPTHCVMAGPLDLTTATGRMHARISGAVARHEVEHMIERQKRAKAQAAADGKWRGGVRPFGYMSDGVTPEPTEAAIVREMTERVLLGESLNSLTRELNERGVRTSTGGPWQYTTLRRLIMRHRNAGIVEHNGQEIADAAWPPIVNRDTWRAARALMTDPSRRTPRTMRERFLGSGLFVCGVCNDGTTMLTATTMGSGHRQQPSYRCRAGSHLTRMAVPVDDYVSAVVIERLGQPDARLLVRPERAVDVPALQDRSNALRGRLDELGTLYGAGSIDARQLATGSATIRAQLDQIETGLAAAVAGSPLAGFLDADNVREAWDAATVGRRKAIIRELMTVTILKAPRGRQPDGSYFDPSYIQIEWRST